MRHYVGIIIGSILCAFFFTAGLWPDEMLLQAMLWVIRGMFFLAGIFMFGFTASLVWWLVFGFGGKNER